MASRALLLALVSAPIALADLPVHCLHSQIKGEWTFSLGPAAPSHHAIPNCSAAFETTMTMKVALGRDVDRPGVALVTEASSGAPVSLGEEGTWTTIYDEGFEVRVGGQHFFAFSKYNRGLARSYARDARAAKYSAASAASKFSTELLQTMPSGDDLDTALRLSQCEQTFPGEYHSASIENWGCYRAQKTNSAPARCRGAACASWMAAAHSAAATALLSLGTPASTVGPIGGAPSGALQPEPPTHGDVVAGDTLTFRTAAGPAASAMTDADAAAAEPARQEPKEPEEPEGEAERRARKTYHARRASGATARLSDEWLAHDINGAQGLWTASATQLQPRHKQLLTLQLFQAAAREHAGPLPGSATGSATDEPEPPRQQQGGGGGGGGGGVGQQQMQRGPGGLSGATTPFGSGAVLGNSTVAMMPVAATALVVPMEQRPLLYTRDRLPDAIDWRTHKGGGWLSPVTNQLQGGSSCGSCYAFSTLAQVEARVRIATNKQQDERLSVLDIIGCSPYSQGCDGGFPYLVGKYGMDFGFAKDACLPYNMSLWAQAGGEEATVDAYLDHALPCERVYARSGASQQCRALRRRVRNVRYVGGYYGAATAAEMKEELATKGPLTVGLYADRNFTVYSRGIYRSVVRDFWQRSVGRIAPAFDPSTCHSGCTPPSSRSAPHVEWQQVNHAVLLVGYGTEQVDGEPVDYWIAQNSWGDRWGESGFFRIERGTGEASIESLAVSVEPMV